MRGWSHEDNDEILPRKSESERFIWCWSIKTWAAICSISARVGCIAETLRRWVRQAAPSGVPREHGVTRY